MHPHPRTPTTFRPEPTHTRIEIDHPSTAPIHSAGSGYTVHEHRVVVHPDPILSTDLANWETASDARSESVYTIKNLGEDEEVYERQITLKRSDLGMEVVIEVGVRGYQTSGEERHEVYKRSWMDTVMLAPEEFLVKKSVGAAEAREAASPAKRSSGKTSTHSRGASSRSGSGAGEARKTRARKAQSHGKTTALPTSKEHNCGFDLPASSENLGSRQADEKAHPSAALAAPRNTSTGSKATDPFEQRPKVRSSRALGPFIEESSEEEGG